LREHSANRGYAQDAEHGKTLFKLALMHIATGSMPIRVGPGLRGNFIGRKAGYRSTAASYIVRDEEVRHCMWITNILDAYLRITQQTMVGFHGNRICPYA